MQKEKVIVTGGAGFIGSHLVDELVRRGFDTHVIDNYAGGKREDRFNAQATYHEIDVRKYEEILPVMDGAIYVFHEAALPRVQFSIENPELTFSVNVLGTNSVLQAARDVNSVKRVIYAASSSAYGDQETLPLHEDLPVQPKSPYAMHKYFGEVNCRMWNEVYGLSTVSLRYFNVYGPGFDPNGPYALVIGKFLLQKSKGEPITITGDGTHTRDFTNVRDIVAANMLAAESSAVGKGEVINIGAGRNVSINDLAAMIGGPTVHVEPRLEPAHTLADITRAKDLLGWAPTVKIEDGIAELKKGMGL